MPRPPDKRVGQRGRVELPQRAVELVGEPLTDPDQVLMAAGQDLDRLGKLTVTRDPSVLVPIAADRVSQHPDSTSIGLGADRFVLTASDAKHRSDEAAMCCQVGCGCRCRRRSGLGDGLVVPSASGWLGVSG